MIEDLAKSFQTWHQMHNLQMKKTDGLDFIKIKIFQSQNVRKCQQTTCPANDMYTKHIKTSQNSTIVTLQVKKKKLQINIPYKYIYKTFQQI